MKAASAKANILPTLMQCKIVDDSGKPGDRARQWRDDGQYPKLCEELRQEIYSSELREALPPPSPDRSAVENWFANNTGVGKTAAKKMAAVYILLCAADPIKQDSDVAAAKPRNSNSGKSTRSPGVNGKKKTPTPAVKNPEPTITNASSPPSKFQPSIHIDIQIHIDPETTADQVDQIFASMAKHLGGLVTQNE
jgi:hypothetical protein